MPGDKQKTALARGAAAANSNAATHTNALSCAIVRAILADFPPPVVQPTTKARKLNCVAPSVNCVAPGGIVARALARTCFAFLFPGAGSGSGEHAHTPAKVAPGTHATHAVQRRSQGTSTQLTARRISFLDSQLTAAGRAHAEGATSIGANRRIAREREAARTACSEKTCANGHVDNSGKNQKFGF